jgi:membrane fusion protein, multidrug efflux system
MMKTRRLYAVLAAAAVLAAGCKGAPKEDEASKEEERSIALGPETWAVATLGRIESGPRLSGTLAPRREATLRAQVPGAVTAAYADGGQAVGSGAILATIDAQTIRTQVESARSAVANAQSSLDLARREQERLQSLFDVGAIAAREVDVARRNTVAAQSALTQARSQLTAAQRQLTYTQVRAPFAGRVSEKLVGTGDIVQPGTAMYTIVDPSSLQLEALIPTEQIDRVRPGDPVEFRVNGIPDRTFSGRITRINPSVDPATRQVRVYAEIPNSGNDLLADLFAEGTVATQVRNATTVPTRAIDRRQMRPSVMRVRSGRPERVEVTLGVTDSRSDRVEVLSGIVAGDTVLVGAGLQTPPGTLVTLTARGGATTATGAAAGEGAASAPTGTPGSSTTGTPSTSAGGRR